MPTVIDELIVAFKLDDKQFSAGSQKVNKATADTAKSAAAGQQTIDAAQRKNQESIRKTGQATDENRKQWDRHTKSVADGFTKIRNEALAFLAIWTGGKALGDFASDTINSAASISRLSQNLGISAKELIGWSRAGEQFGSTQEAMRAQLQKTATELAGIQAGFDVDNPHMRQLINLGGDGSVQNQGKTFEDYLYAQADAIKKAKDARGEQFAQFAAGQMGITDPGIFNLMKEGSGPMRAAMEAQKALTHTTDAQAKASDELRQKWLNFKNEIGDTATQVLLDLEPALKQLLTQLDKLALWVQDNQSGIAGWAAQAVTAVKEFVIAANSAAQAVGGWHVVLEGLLALKVLSMVAPLLTLAGALTRVGGGLAAVGASGAGVGVLARAGQVLTSLAPGAAAAAGAGLAAATGAAYLLHRLAPNHQEGDVNPDTGKVWHQKTYGRGGQGEWVDANGGVTRVWQQGAATRGGHAPGRYVYKRIAGATSGPVDTIGFPSVGTGAAAGASSSSSSFGDLDDYARQVEQRYGLPAGLLVAVKNLGERSHRRKDGTYPTSSAGAQGLMQFIPETWKKYGAGKDPSDPRASLEASGRYFKDLLKQYHGNTAAAIAAYNGGNAAGASVELGYAPPAKETRDYLDRIQQGGGLGISLPWESSNLGIAQQGGPGGGDVSTTSTDITIGEVKIYTQATDAQGIANTLSDKLRRVAVATQVDTGMSQ